MAEAAGEPRLRSTSYGGQRKIEDIKVGDKVASFIGDEIVESEVSNIYKVTRSYYYSLAGCRRSPDSDFLNGQDARNAKF